jgi:metal-responsive CopG/Arc/MetJ family transcriptional regulator
MAQETKTERIHMLMSPSEVAEIDAFAQGVGLRTRAEGIRRLVRAALTVHRRTAEMRHEIAILQQMKKDGVDWTPEHESALNELFTQLYDYDQLFR